MIILMNMVLFSGEELKTLRVFEAIILIPRIMPIKTYEMKKIKC